MDMETEAEETEAEEIVMMELSQWKKVVELMQEDFQEGWLEEEAT